jgi:hypothetical protein
MKRRDFIALAGSATPLWTPLARAGYVDGRIPPSLLARADELIE